MEKLTKFKVFDDSTVESYELFPFVDRALGKPAHTSRGRETLLRRVSKTKAPECGSKHQERQNIMLRRELERVNEELGKNKEEIELLRKQLTNGNTESTKISDDAPDYKTGVNETETEHNTTLTTGDTLSRHFKEMMNRYHRTLADKDRQIKSLQETLAQLQRCNHPQERQEAKESNAHPSIEAERLRRTNAAVRVFRRDAGLARTQLEHSPLAEERIHSSSSRDRMVADELRRRQRFGVVADLEAVGNRFFQRLEFEERLDKLHWELESRRHRGSTGGECAPTCTHHQEFQMLQTTRNNLLKALRDLRATSTQTKLHVPISINTIHTLYRASPERVTSHNSARETTSELPDK